MKFKSKNSLLGVFGLAILLSFSLIFSACNTSAPQNGQETEKEQQSEVFLPSTGSDTNTETEVETKPEEAAYPSSEQDTQNSEMAEASANEAYPDPKVEEATAVPTSVPDVEPTKGPQPTARGDALVATDPATVSLASGKVQLVELFAFW